MKKQSLTTLLSITLVLLLQTITYTAHGQEQKAAIVGYFKPGTRLEGKENARPYTTKTVEAFQVTNFEGKNGIEIRLKDGSIKQLPEDTTQYVTYKLDEKDLLAKRPTRPISPKINHPKININPTTHPSFQIAQPNYLLKAEKLLDMKNVQKDLQERTKKKSSEY